MTVLEYMIRVALYELAYRAGDNNLYFDYVKSQLVYIVTQDFDYRPLDRYRELFGGAVFVSHNSPYHSTLEKGDYSWRLTDREAYLLCRALEPLIAKYAGHKHEYCQGLMMRYMTNESHPNRQDNSSSAKGN